MLPKLQKEFEALNRSLKTLFTYTDHLSQDKLHQSPAGEWNAVQIIYHLKESEQGTLSYLSKKIQASDGEVESGGISSKIRSFLLSRALRDRMKKFKVPSVFKEIPENPDYQETREQYLEARKNLSILLTKFDKKMMSKAYFKHPRAGRITIMQTMGFLKDHFDRHVEQVLERSS